MLRFRFGMDDLARVQFAEPPSTALIVLSAQLLRQPEPPLFLPWHRHAPQQLPQAARSLFDLCPPSGHIPDFLTPVAAGGALEAAYESILAVPTDRIWAELAHAHHDFESAPSWVRGLAEGDTGARHVLIEALGAYYHVCLARFLPRLREQIRADLAHRGDLLVSRGLEHLLSTLHPAVRWRSPYLECRAGCCDIDIDIDLRSRGLRLWPTPFLTSHPRALIWEGVPTLAYPPYRPILDWDDTRTPGDPLAELIGQTRAEVLRTLIHQPSTSTIARLLHSSVPTASRHVTALRNAGLATTRRTGRSTQHSLTALGLRLLESTGG